MKRALRVLLVLACGVALASAGNKDKKKVKTPVPALVTQAQYVYLTSYDGPETSFGVSPADRQALATVQDAIRKWGKYRVTLRQQDADLILLVRAGRTLDARVGGGVHTGSDRPTTTTGPNTRVEVSSSGLEDELAVYQRAAGLNSAPLWRGLMANGLQAPAPALVEKLRAAVEETEKVLKEQEQQKKQKP
ncbi:MAG TPA: hypothetical protein VLA96_03920 [Terriglobales bacterium]|jgi:hypothetical protein|nr:hypothetical protein [Terriglobales bacterium]